MKLGPFQFNTNNQKLVAFDRPSVATKVSTGPSDELMHNIKQIDSEIQNYAHYSDC